MVDLDFSQGPSERPKIDYLDLSNDNIDLDFSNDSRPSSDKRYEEFKKDNPYITDEALHGYNIPRSFKTIGRDLLSAVEPYAATVASGIANTADFFGADNIGSVFHETAEDLTADATAWSRIAEEHNDHLAEAARMATYMVPAARTLKGAMVGEGLSQFMDNYGRGDTAPEALTKAGIGAATIGAIGAVLRSPEIIEWFKQRGLNKTLKDALASGDEATLRELYKEAKIAKKIGIGDNVYAKGRGPGGSLTPKDITHNTVEQRAFADSARDISKKALTETNKLVETDKHINDLKQDVLIPIKAQYKRFKDPMVKAYKNLESTLDDRRLYDLTTQVDKWRNHMKQQGYDEAVINYVNKHTQPYGRHLTEGQKAAAKEAKKLERQISFLKDMLSKGKLKNPGATVNKLKRLERNLAAANKTLEDPSVVLSERDIVNLMKGISSRRFISGGDSIKSNRNIVRQLSEIRDMIMQDTEKLLALNKSPTIGKFKEANKLARNYYKFMSNSRVRKLLSDDPDVVSDSFIALLNRGNVDKAEELLKHINDPKVSERLAKAIVRHSITPIEAIRVGEQPRLDMQATAHRFKLLWDHIDTKQFLQRHLPKDEFARLEATHNVLTKIAPFLDSVEHMPGWTDYVREGTSLTNRAGRALESLYDFAGFLKNRTISNIPGLKWTSSRINTEAKLANKVMKILERGPKTPLSMKDKTLLQQFITRTAQLKKLADKHEAIAATAGSAAGALGAGLEQDDQGNYSYDPIKGALGALGGGMVATKTGRQALKEGISEQLQKIDAHPKMLPDMPYLKYARNKWGDEVADELQDNLYRAALLHKQGMHPKDIHAQTGWSYDSADRMFKRPMDKDYLDTGGLWKDLLSNEPNTKISIKDYLDEHLLDAVPDLDRVTATKMTNIKDYAAFNTSTDEILLPSDKISEEGTLAHEVEHAIQKHTNQIAGSNPSIQSRPRLSKAFIRDMSNIPGMTNQLLMDLQEYLQGNMSYETIMQELQTTLDSAIVDDIYPIVKRMELPGRVRYLGYANNGGEVNARTADALQPSYIDNREDTGIADAMSGGLEQEIFQTVPNLRWLFPHMFKEIHK